MAEATPVCALLRHNKPFFLFLTACAGLLVFLYLNYTSSYENNPLCWQTSRCKPHIGDVLVTTMAEMPPTSADGNQTKAYQGMYREHLKSEIDRHCSPVPSMFQSWQYGIVTQMGPPLKRDCHKLRQNPALEMNNSNLNLQLQNWKNGSPWEAFASRLKQMTCDEIKREFENIFYVSQVEKDFPIAYIFVVYTNAGQVLRLLKAIYRPHNLYCIHPDARQGDKFKEYFTAIARCLDNVFIVSNPVKVYYGHISITDAQLHCMQDLVQYPESRWKYIINLCGREIPLKTNSEIVDSLQQLKGYSALGAYPLPKPAWEERFKNKYHLDKKGELLLTKEKQANPPQGIKLYKSMNFMAASRAFVHFILNDTVAKELHDFLGTVYAPEEHFYSSLYALPQAKGAKPPPGLMIKDGIPKVDNFIWIVTQSHREHLTQLCPGKKVVHNICILSTFELEIIERSIQSKQPILYFNKYFLERDPIPMDCMEERLVEANMEEYMRHCREDNRYTNDTLSS